MKVLILESTYTSTTKGWGTFQAEWILLVISLFTHMGIFALTPFCTCLLCSIYEKVSEMT